jgi:hypothetical protein
MYAKAQALLIGVIKHTAKTSHNPFEASLRYASPTYHNPLNGFKLFIHKQKQSKMALNFKVREAQKNVTATVIGTVASVIGKGGSVDFIPSNLLNADKRLYVILTKADGTSDSVICSQAVSDAFRAKEISVNHLLGFEIKEQVSSAGELYNQINMPSSNASLINFKVDDITVEEFKVEALTDDKIKNLIAVSL